MALNVYEPVIDAATLSAKVTGVIAGLGAVATLLGFGTDEVWSNAAQAAGALILSVSGLVGAVLPIINAFKARALVTPVAQPRDANGKALTPAGE